MCGPSTQHQHVEGRTLPSGKSLTKQAVYSYWNCSAEDCTRKLQNRAERVVTITVLKVGQLYM